MPVTFVTPGPVGESTRAGLVLAGTYGQAAHAMAPTYYYRLGESPGETVMFDSSGGSRHGSYVGGVLLGQPPLCLNAGGDGAVRLDSATAYGVADPITAAGLMISCIIELPDVSGQHTIAEADGGMPDDGWSFEVKDGKLRAYIRTGPGGGTASWIGGSSAGFGSLVNNTRHHVMLYLGAGGAELWLDGTLLVRDTTRSDAVAANTSNLSIGSYHGLSGLGGFIDEFLVFKRHLSAGEIDQLNQPDAAVPPPFAQDDAFAAITENTGDHDFDVLANDSYSGIPSIAIVDESGPGTAAVTGTGAAARIRVPTTAGLGTKTVTYALTHSGGDGSSQALVTVDVVAASTGPYCTFFTGTTVKGAPAVVTRPTYRTAFFDPDSDYPCRIVRVVNNPGESVGVGGLTWPSLAYHAYSTQPAWNADGSRLFIARLNFGVMLDGFSYLPVSANLPPNSHFYWHPTDPAKGYLVDGGNTLKYWFHANGSTQVVKTFSGWDKLGWGKDRVNDSGGVEAVPSNDGDVVPLVGRWLSDGTMRGFLYKISTDTIYGSRAMKSSDHLSVSPDGDYAVEHNDLRVTLYNVDQTSQLASSSSPSCKHQNCAKYQGQQYMVGVNRSNGDIVRKGPFPAVTATTILNVGTALHVTARNIGLEDWCFVSMTQDSSRSSEPYYDEALMLKMDGSTIRRLGRLRIGPSVTGTAYNNEHHVCPAPNGTRAIFASNWHSSNLSPTPPGGEQVGAYVIEGCDYTGTLFA
jgi:hypothetical protein